MNEGKALGVLGGVVAGAVGFTVGVWVSSADSHRVRVEAVQHGHATWAAQDDGTTEFRWNEPEANDDR